jgi:CubicO group peptidase (beta-lactamase class C family)
MSKNVKIILAVLLIALLAAGFIYGPKYLRAMEIAEKSKMEHIEDTFINMGNYFMYKTVSKAPQPYLFARKTNEVLPESFDYDGVRFNTMEFLDSSYTQGFLVLQDDTIVYENYWRGQKEDTRHISWSMAKSVISALLGIAQAEGHMGSVDKNVEEYLPELKGSGYEGVKVKDVLQMSSGVKFNEDYGDPSSDINRWFRAFALGDSQDEFAATMVNERTPGTYNHYVSINTHVLGMILVRTTGKSIAQYFKEKLWDPIGAEHDAYWLKDNKDMEMALGGLNATLRDYAKVGRLFLNRGNWNGKQVVPESWVNESLNMDAEHVTPSSNNSAHPHSGYGYQWWIPPGDDGEFWARGVFNQYIYINPTTNTVIVKNSANQNFYDQTNPHSIGPANLELMRAIANRGYEKEIIEMEGTD